MNNLVETPVLDQMAAEIARQRNAQFLEGKKRFAQKYPDIFNPALVAAPTTDYRIETFRFDYIAFFYIRFECYITYQSGQKFQFHGEGGGAGIGDGIFAGGGQPFFVPPNELPGRSDFFFMPEALGGLVHFWRGPKEIGSLVGAGAGGLSLGFGGNGTWSPGP
jgi:hypothetical protein